MTSQLSDDDLTKAARNLDRIESFFLQRAMWRLPADCRGALKTARDAASSLAGAVHEECGGLAVDVDDQLSIDAVPKLPESDFDRYRLLKFAAFFEQLNRWFRTHSEPTPSPAGENLLGTIAHALARTVAVTDFILERTEDEAQPPAEASEPVAEEAPDPVPLEAPPNAPQLLPLEDTDKTPLLQEFKGALELTDTARHTLAGFLTAWNVQLEGSSLRHLEQRVLRWLEATPDGQMLVLKMGTLHGRFEPYPSYLKRPDPAPAAPS